MSRQHLGHAVAGIALHTQRRVQARAHQSDHYAMTERTQQFQFDISGTLGVVPVESNVEVLFDITFLYEYGMRRDSQLLEPQTHFGWTQINAPPGSVPFAHVTGWKQDADLNYVGASITAGVHNPSIGIIGTDPTSSLTFSGTLHVTFQGYGVPVDPADGEA